MLFPLIKFTLYIIYKKIRTLNLKLLNYDSRSLDRLHPCILLIQYWLQQILKKYKKSKRYSQLQELHIQCIVDELKGENKEENFNKFFDILQSSLSTIGSFKFLVLCHKLIYQLQQEFTSRFIQNKLIPGDDTDKSRLAIYYYNFLFKLCENFDYYKEVIEFIETDNIVKFLKYELFVQIQILYPLAQMLQELSQVVKLLDYLLCRESPLLLQLGTCILKDFCYVF
ncbi:unnamed protein product [Paramecium octaurelia]|uniref:Uncharacterized protein n=1 Tax=Paramecium octaurelia TaxID=43137 RepID=A0A8S1XA75_PAROT|nr:unnamed protein product [Paramecium octaurelia]